jgi:hypothetical protein
MAGHNGTDVWIIRVGAAAGSDVSEQFDLPGRSGTVATTYR